LTPSIARDCKQTGRDTWIGIDASAFKKKRLSENLESCKPHQPSSTSGGTHQSLSFRMCGALK